jgi:trimeric autotransporter adhesin
LKSTIPLVGLFATFLAASALQAQNVQVDKTLLNFSTQVGGQPATQTLNVTSSGASIPFVAAANAQWLKLNGGTFANGNTPSAVTVTADASGLAQGTYNGQITVSGGSGPSASVLVTFTIGSIGVNPASLQFSSVVGSVPSSQSIALSGQTATFTASATTQSGGNWLQVSPPSGVSPSNIVVTFDPAITQGLAAGTYQGSVTITPTSGASLNPITIPVTLSITTSPAVTVNPSGITLNYQTGGTNNAQSSQVLTINNSGGAAVSYSIIPSVENNPAGRIWLLATPSSGSIPANSSVQVTLAYDTTANLPPGTYGGANTKVTLSTPGATPTSRDIPVNLLVSTAPLLNVPNAALAFTYQQNGSVPPAQSVTPTSTAVAANSTSGQMSLSITATTQGNSGNWLVVPSTGVTGTPITVSVNPAGLAPGTYTGSVSVTGAGAANGAQTFPVTLLVSNDPLISANSCTASNLASCGVVFPFQIGQSAPVSRNITVTSTASAALNYSAAFSSSTCGGQWLVFGGTTGGTTSGTFTISPNPANLAAATVPITCTGVVTITATNPATGATVLNSPLSIPVTLAIDTNPMLVVAPASPLSFQAQVNGTPTASQLLTVSSTNPVAPLNYSISFTPTSGGNWLLVGPGNGSTSSGINQVTVSANPGLLSPGTYTGTISITATNPSGAAVSNSPVTIPVSLQVTTPIATGPTVTLNPTSLTFATGVNAPSAPATQTVAVASSGTPIAFAATAATTSGGNWLTVTPANGTTPGTLTVSIDQTRFTTAGTYNGTISVAAPGAANTPQTLQVTVNVAAPATPSVTAVRNAASYSAGVIAPGENIVLGGTNIGPGTLAQLQLNSSGGVATTLSNTQVLFDGIPAPIIYASGNQTSVMVPYEIAGRASTNIQVQYQGVTSQSIPYTVAQSAPGIYTLNQQGTGPGAILNQDYSLNGSGKPAAKGSVVQIFMTGEGQTSPAGVTGSVAPNSANGLKSPVLPVNATVGGMTANVQYAGSAPGFITGVMQVNVLIPANAPSGAQPLVISVGGTPTQQGVTVAIQ